jgi:hypothetical protein
MIFAKPGIPPGFRFMAGPEVLWDSPGLRP